MHELFYEMLKDIKRDVYCSCWKLEDKDKINLYYLMKDFGFVCVQEAHISLNLDTCKSTDKKCCVNYRPNCRCQEDLFVKRYN